MARISLQTNEILIVNRDKYLTSEAAVEGSILADGPGERRRKLGKAIWDLRTSCKSSAKNSSKRSDNIDPLLNLPYKATLETISVISQQNGTF